MLVHLHQFKREEVDFDDNRTAGESQTEDAVDKETEEYFGSDAEGFEAETWETVEHEGDPIQRRSVSIGGVNAVSVPQEPAEGDDSDLPGRTLQIRMGGEQELVEQAVIVEVQDEEP